MPRSNSRSTSASPFKFPVPEVLDYPKPPSPPLPPSFPTLEQIAAGSPAVADTPKHKGIFWDLFGGQPDALIQDAVTFPDRYSSEFVRLATDLAELRRKVEDLTPEEAALLNTGSLEFYQYRPQTIQKQKAPTLPSRLPAEDRIVDPPARPDPLADLPPGAEARPYWWL